MSGIYIPGLSMPDDENDSIHILRDGTAVVYRTESIDFYKAIPVPEHGRLIDADVLFDFIFNIYKTAQGDARKAYRDVLDTIVAAGDVIPEEVDDEIESKTKG